MAGNFRGGLPVIFVVKIFHRRKLIPTVVQIRECFRLYTKGVAKNIVAAPPTFSSNDHCCHQANGVFITNILLLSHAISPGFFAEVA
jgi:hypothetical protein